MFATDGDRRIFFDVLGQTTGWRDGALVERPTIIAVHGGPGIPSTYLRPWLSLLAEDFGLVLLDLRGAGWSSRHPGSGYPLAGLVDDVELVRRTLGLDQVVLLGHSFGGPVVMEYALEHPEHVSALVLASTIRSMAVTREQAAIDPPAMDEADLPVVTEFMTQMFTAWASGDTEALTALDAHPGWRVISRSQWLSKPALQDVVDANIRFGTEVYVANTGAASAMPDAAALGSWDITPRLGDIKAPALVVTGDSAAEFVARPEPHARPIAAAIPGAELKVVPGVGHYLFAEQPEGFRDLVRDFLVRSGLEGAVDDRALLASASS